MTVPVQVPITSAVANGVTTVFPYQFKVARSGDLVVTVNGLVRTEGTHYTVDGVGNDAGGNVTFLLAPIDTAKVVLRRVMAFKRDTNFATLGDLLAATLNLDQDDPVMMIQQLAATTLQLTEDGDGEFVWDATGFRLINLGDAVDPQDAVNLRSMINAIEQATGTGSGGSGNISVTPQLWTFTGDGVTSSIMLDSNVDNPLFYDVAIGGVLLEPYTDYHLSGTPGNLTLTFTSAPADGKSGWVVLRGYARPYSGQQPILTVSPKLKAVSVDTTLDNSYQNTIIQVDSPVPVTLSIPANIGATTDWKDGDFFSVIQMGAGKVTVVMATTGTLLTLPGFDAKARGQYSVFSVSCLSADSDQWVATGDLLAQTNTPDIQAFTLPCSDEATTQIAVASNVYRFRMPFGVLLSDVRATLNVAQPSGTVLTVDVKQNGTSIFSTLLTLDNAELTSTEASAPAVLVNPDNTVLGDGDLISVDVAQVGDAGARGLKVQLIGQRA